MASITIRNLSMESKERLQRCAEQRGCSLEALVRSILDHAAEQALPASRFPHNLIALGRVWRGHRAVHARAPAASGTGRAAVIFVNTNVLPEVRLHALEPTVRQELRDLLYAVLLQAEADAHAGRSPGGHPSVGAGGRGSAGGGSGPW